MTHAYANFNGGFVESLLKWGRGWIITLMQLLIHDQIKEYPLIKRGHMINMD